MNLRTLFLLFAASALMIACDKKEGDSAAGSGHQRDISGGGGGGVTGGTGSHGTGGAMTGGTDGGETGPRDTARPAGSGPAR